MSGAFKFIREHQVLFACGLLVGILGIGMLISNSVSWEDSRIAAIRRAGQPVSLADLNSYYAFPPGSTNAAALVQAAFEHEFIGTNSSASEIEANMYPERGETLKGDRLENAEALLRMNSESLQALHKVQPGMPSRYPLDFVNGVNMLLPHLGKMKSGVSLLALEALHQHAQGRSDEAVNTLTAAFGVADTLRREPLAISHLVWVASQWIPLSAMERIAQSGNLDDAQLARLQAMASHVEDAESLSRGLIGERAFGLSYFIDRATQQSMFGGGPGGGSTIRAALTVGLLKTTGIMTRDRAFFLDQMSNRIALASLPLDQRFTVPTNAWSVEAPNRFFMLSRNILPALENIPWRSAELLARGRALQVGVAIQRFRLAHSRLPESLDELAPRYIQTVPLDPYTAKALIYKREQGGQFRVYSTGMDRTDNGGEGIGKSGMGRIDPGVHFVR